MELDLYREREKIDYALEIGRPEQAVELIQNVLQVEPEEPYFLTSLASAYFDLDELYKAEAAVLESLRVDPEFFWSYGIYGIILWQKDQPEKAEQQFLKALELYPESQMVLNAYSRFLFYKKDETDKAKEYTLRLLEIDPDNEEAHYTLAEIYRSKSEFDQAIAQYLHLLSMNPEHEDCYYKLGIIYLYAKNQPKKAFEYLKNAIRLDPTNAELREDFMQALKAKNKLYAAFWGWSLLLAKSGKWKWGLIIVPWFLMRLLRGYAEDHPEHMAILSPIVFIYALFVIYTWTADPVFNLFVRKGWIK